MKIKMPNGATHYEELSFKGRAVLAAVHRITGEKIIIKSENLRVTVGKTWLLNYLVNEAGYDNGFTYCALGNNNTAPAIGQTTLVAEQSRNAITSKPGPDSGVELTLSTFFTAAESTFYIKEAAIFGHNASATPNSGTMWARWLVSFDNSLAEYDITIDYILTVD